MLTFLIALLFVFFAHTSIATKVAMGIITAFLGTTVILLLYLEGEGTILEQNPFPRAWSLLSRTLRSLCDKWSSNNPTASIGWYQHLRMRRHRGSDSSASTTTLSEKLPGP